MTTSTATPDTTTPEQDTPLQRRASTHRQQTARIQSTGPPSQKPGSVHERLMSIMNNRTSASIPPDPITATTRFRPGAINVTKSSDFLRGVNEAGPKGRQRSTAAAQTERSRKNVSKTLIMLERHMSRQWRAGDVYSPHDLSPAEQLKAQTARLSHSRFRMLTRARSRNRGGADVLDVLRLNPVKEYKNYSIMARFVSETGRIRSARETGLRAVNQRKVAKAVRRSIGMGLVPSVHQHPELIPEREEQRRFIWRRNADRRPS